MLTVEVLASRENCLATGPGHELSSIDSREFSRLSWKSRSACTAVVTLLDRVNLRKLGGIERDELVQRCFSKQNYILCLFVGVQEGVSSSQSAEVALDAGASIALALV